MTHAPPVPAPPPGPGSTSNTQTILVVDDNPRNVLAIEAALESLANGVTAVNSGSHALRALLNGDYAVILLDVRMPVMDGFETARRIRERERNRRTPIIFITAYDPNDSDIREAYSLGAVDFLFKPLAPEILCAKVATFLDLQKRTLKTAHQAELLRQHELREQIRAFEEERRLWEEAALKERMNEQQRANANLRRYAEDLARTVAERQRAELELKRKNAELADADRKKDRFLAVLSHELRNPLAALLASVERLAGLAPDVGDPIAQPLMRSQAIMSRQLSHLNRLVDDLLDVARINSDAIQLRKEAATLNEVIHCAVDNCRQAIDLREQRLDLLVPDADVWLDADPARLTQAVGNLLSNASRYTPLGGEIRLTAATCNEEAVIEVLDTGRGIAPERIEEIFEVFVRDPAGEGLGLGLPLARRLVEMHGGTLSAFSEGAGRGSRFTIRVGLGKKPVHAAPTANGRLQHAPSPLNVVLIEDDVDVSDAVRELLESWGHSVQVALNGQAGLTLIQQASPDVAVVDLGLPDMDGCDLATRVLSLNSRPRLIAMSGYGRAEDRKRASSSGFDVLLVKPATAQHLSKALQSCMRGPKTTPRRV